MNDLKNDLLNNGFVVLPLSNLEILEQANSILNSFFSSSVNFYSSMKRENFHELVEAAQIKLNDAGILRNFISAHNQSLTSFLNDGELAWVNVMKLRAVRPKKYLLPTVQDHVGFHRESLYATSKQVYYQYNCWTPLTEAATKSGIWCIPGSHMLLDSALHVNVRMDSPVRVERYSSGHRIGLPYLPKDIDSTPELLSARPERIIVPYGHFALFTTQLIHGGGRI